MSLREHVLQVLRSGPKTKEEVLHAVQERGYRFQTKDPLNSLGVILYGRNPKFNRVDGRFSLAAGGSKTLGGNAGSGRRQMSPASLARIAGAQKKRWANRDAHGNNGVLDQKSNSTSSSKRTFSPAARRAVAEAAKKRWAAAKRAGKNRL